MASEARTAKRRQEPKADEGRPPRTTIAVQGARVHNLKNISLEIPRDSLDRRHRALGLGQVEPGVRHDLRRGAAALHGVAVELRQAVRRPGGEARRGLRLRPVAGDLDRAEDDRQQPALDRRHDDGHRQLPEPPVRDDRPAALPAHRRADAEPDVEPDPRGDPVAAGRDGDRAAGAGVQGLRRGAGLRLHRGAEEGLPAADHRRQAGGHLRRGRPRRIEGPGHGRRGGPLRGRPEARERRSRRGSPARCWWATGSCRFTSSKAQARPKPSVSTRACAAPRTTSSTAGSSPSTSCSTIRRAPAGPAAAWASTRSRTRSCWCPIRSGASWAAASCVRRSSTTRTPGTAG